MDWDRSANAQWLHWWTFELKKDMNKCSYIIDTLWGTNSNVVEGRALYQYIILRLMNSLKQNYAGSMNHQYPVLFRLMDYWYTILMDNKECQWIWLFIFYIFNVNKGNNAYICLKKNKNHNAQWNEFQIASYCTSIQFRLWYHLTWFNSSLREWKQWETFNLP